MLPSQEYYLARKKAELHVQVELDPVKEMAWEGRAYVDGFTVSGKVVRIFRGDRTCQLGENINFDIAIFNDELPQDELRDRMPMSGILWLGYKGLLPGKYMEVYLNNKPPTYEVALYQYLLIDVPTIIPKIRLSTPRLKWFGLLAILRRVLKNMISLIDKIEYGVSEDDVW